jgi:hypothetical protein
MSKVTWSNEIYIESTCLFAICSHSMIIINFIFCPNIIYFCSVKLDFSISYKESGFKIITISWNIAISCIYEWIKCCPKRKKLMLNYNKISGIYILTNPVIYKWPNRFVYMFTFWPSRISKTSVLMNDWFYLEILFCWGKVS